MTACRAVAVLRSTFDPRSPVAQTNREAMAVRLAELAALDATREAGGGERYVERHRSRGRLLARERIELLVDRDSPFLELQPYAAAQSDFHVGASVVTGIGVVEGVECVLSANDPTIRGGSSNPFSLRKALRAQEVALANRLPLIGLVESGGADLPTQAEAFVPGGETFANLTRLSAAGIPTLALVFGSSTAGGAYLPGMSDHTIFVDGAASVFLGGPPLVEVATGERSTEVELGGAGMHARASGLADHLAVDERDALRLGREVVGALGWRKAGRGPDRPVEAPLADPEELDALPSADPKVPFATHEVLARVLDGSRYAEHKPLFGPSLTCGWGHVHGYAVGIVANVRGVLFGPEAEKAAQFIQLANQRDVPLVFLHNATGFMVGAEYEQAGIIRAGARMINAVANSTVPHLGVVIGGSYGAANYAMSGRGFDPRFLFSWPNAQSSVMGPAQLAGVLSIVARAAAQRRGTPYDDATDAAMRTAVEGQIEQEQTALANSSRGYDDGIIDPRDTRAVLGMALSAVHGAEVRGASMGYGVVR